MNNRIIGRCAKFYGGGFGRVYEPKTPVIKLCTPPDYPIIIADHFTGAHPPMMKFVNAVKQQQRATDFILNRLDHEIDNSGKRKKKRINESILRDHLRNFANVEISDYMYKLVTIIGYTYTVNA